jgi:hypothetical protein
MQPGSSYERCGVHACLVLLPRVTETNFGNEHTYYIASQPGKTATSTNISDSIKRRTCLTS